MMINDFMYRRSIVAYICLLFSVVTYTDNDAFPKLHDDIGLVSIAGAAGLLFSGYRSFILHLDCIGMYNDMAENWL